MVESETDPSKLKQSILDLFVTAGFTEAPNGGLSAAGTLAGGLAWCISNTNAVGPEFRCLSDQEFALKENNVKVTEVIEAALRSIGCPYPLKAYQIQDLDYSGIYPVVQWTVNYVLTMQSKTKDENQKKANILNDMQVLHKIDKDNDTDIVDRLILLLESLKASERRESDLRAYCKQKHSDLQADVIELEREPSSGGENKNNSDDIEHSLCMGKLNLAKSELAAKLRAILLVKRQLADMPSQSELIQYERRFSELYVQIQDKLCQTRKFYATYNALLEIKELMLKETSLLNSISSQFQEAISSTAGRVKLINSMEEVLKGTQQKLGKVQVGLQAELKVCDTLKGEVARLVAEQRHFYSILKAFQEECMKNEWLKASKPSF